MIWDVKIPKSRMPDKMGRAGRTDAEYSTDRACTSGKFPPGIGWEEFTDAAIMALNSQDRPIVFILWGVRHSGRPGCLNNPKHLISKGTASKSAVGISWILRKQAVQPDQ